MPLDGTILGFKNSWYGRAMENAERREIEPGLKILVVVFYRNEKGNCLRCSFFSARVVYQHLVSSVIEQRR